LPGRI